jgi:hypothetical protein
MNPWISILLIFIVIKGKTQVPLMFESKIYFEDANGNKDTIQVAYDTMANSYYNLDLNELDIKSEFNSEFEVRASHYLGWKRNYNECILSKRIVSSCERIINASDSTRVCFKGDGIIFFIKTKNQPIKISWENSDFKDHVLNCQAASFFTSDYLYHLIDPRIWSDLPLKRFACASRESNFILNLNKEYVDSVFSKEFTFSTIRTYFGGLVDTILGVELIFEESYELSPCEGDEVDTWRQEDNEFKVQQVFPNPSKEYIMINNSDINPITEFWIIDHNGGPLNRIINLNQAEKISKLIIDDLVPGIYLIKMIKKDRSFEFSKFVKF